MPAGGRLVMHASRTRRSILGRRPRDRPSMEGDSQLDSTFAAFPGEPPNGDDTWRSERNAGSLIA
jgi:hypothetical protein